MRIVNQWPYKLRPARGRLLGRVLLLLLLFIPLTELTQGQIEKTAADSTCPLRYALLPPLLFFAQPAWANEVSNYPVPVEFSREDLV